MLKNYTLSRTKPKTVQETHTPSKVTIGKNNAPTTLYAAIAYIKFSETSSTFPFCTATFAHMELHTIRLPIFIVQFISWGGLVVFPPYIFFISSTIDVTTTAHFRCEDVLGTNKRRSRQLAPNKFSQARSLDLDYLVNNHAPKGRPPDTTAATSGLKGTPKLAFSAAS